MRDRPRPTRPRVPARDRVHRWAAHPGGVALPWLAGAVLAFVVARDAGAQTLPSSTPATSAPAAVAMPPARIVSAARVRIIGDSLAPAASRTAQLGAGPGYTYAVTHRDSSGGVEVHAAWTDVFIIQNGRAALVSGGTVDGARETTSGEWRGGSVHGGTRAELRAGDVVVIPAGTPHQMLLPPRTRISYLAFKIAASQPHAP